MVLSCFPCVERVPTSVHGLGLGRCSGAVNRTDYDSCRRARLLKARGCVRKPASRRRLSRAAATATLTSAGASGTDTSGTDTGGTDTGARDRDRSLDARPGVRHGLLRGRRKFAMTLYNSRFYAQHWASLQTGRPSAVAGLVP